jgi:exopolysaccharide biosynthesis polyprenyl glycosylphosphotransferase
MSQRIDELRSTVVRPRTAVRTSSPRSRAQRRADASRRSLRWLNVLSADAAAIAVSTILATLLYPAAFGTGLLTSPTAVVVMVISFLSALAVSGSYTRCARGLIASPPFRRARISHGLPLGVVLALLAARTPMAAAAGLELEPEQVTLVALLGLAVIPAARRLVSVLAMPRRGVRRAVILGTGRVAASVAGRLQLCSGVCVVGMVDDDPQDGFGVLGRQAELPEICARHDIDDVVVAFSQKPTHETLELLRGLDDTVSVWVVPRLYELVSWRSAVEELHGIPLLDVAPAQAGRIARAAKRAFDVVIAGALLVFLAPVFAGVAVAIRMTSPGPVIFRQLRSGQNRQPFHIYKFRTMDVDAEQQRAALAEHNEADGPLFKMNHDPRVTHVGEWLRQTSLDELPQLLNVLRGEMSLVGPRPFPVDESEKITGWAKLRFSVPPGITGLWQVSGRNALSYDDLTHLDYIYAASWSFMWDLRILLQTPTSVLHRRGVL